MGRIHWFHFYHSCLAVYFLFRMEGTSFCVAFKFQSSPADASNGRLHAISRRELIGAVAVPVFWNSIGINEVLAAEPISTKETDSLLAIAKRKFRPKPIKALRRKLSQDFAVLLMRSSYNSLDELDCVAMDQFQRDFFLIRSSEYQDYTKSLGDGMVQQGDLTDPYYFDFISFAQYRAINRELTQDPPYVFQEMQIPPEGQGDDDGKPARFVPVVIRRDPNLTNDMLVPTHNSKVGSKILDRLDEIFGDTDSRIPKLGNKPDSGKTMSLVSKYGCRVTCIRERLAHFVSSICPDSYSFISNPTACNFVFD
jgi:hypothetical protein